MKNTHAKKEFLWTVILLFPLYSEDVAFKSSNLYEFSLYKQIWLFIKETDTFDHIVV